MILILIGIIVLIVIILLSNKIYNKGKKYGVIIGTWIWYLGIAVVPTIIIMGIFETTKMGEWEVKEAIEPTLISNEEENTFDGYTYQYIISESWGTKPKVINYTTDGDVPILVKCERKAEPTIWTLGLGNKETKYIFYGPNGTITYLP